MHDGGTNVRIDVFGRVKGARCKYKRHKKKTTSSRCCYCYCHRRRHHLATFQYMFSDAGTIDACICAMHTPCVAPLFGVRG